MVQTQLLMQNPGPANLAGNVLPQLINNGNSKLLNVYDVGKLNIRLNYLYMGLSATSKNQAINNELKKTLTEAISKGYAEQFTQLPAFQHIVTTTIPNLGTNPGMLPELVLYQTFLQNIAALGQSYNKFRVMEQTLMNMSYNREEPVINSLYGLFKKSSFIAILKGILAALPGEYFDLNWYKQINTLTAVPSRKSNSMWDPLVEIVGAHQMPVVSATDASSVKVFDSADYKNPSNVTFQTLVETFLNGLSSQSILAWARAYSNGLPGTQTAVEYFNTMIDVLNDIQLIVAKFKSDFADIRVVLETMNRIGLNNWIQGVNINLQTSTVQYTPLFNKLAFDVINSTLSGCGEMVYDTITYRWKAYTPWHKTLGIPEYDKFVGGSFITFSTRDLESAGGEDFTTSKWLIPQLFTPVTTGSPASPFIRVSNRLGYSVNITRTLFDNATLNASDFTRLNALVVGDIVAKFPTYTESVLDDQYTYSAMSQLLESLFGCGIITDTDDNSSYLLESEIVCFVDIELEDISNQLISWCKAYAPFRVRMAETARTIGFLQ